MKKLLQPSNCEVEAFWGKDMNDVIQEHMPLIIKTISETTKTYVNVETSDEMSIGLLAFVEAIERYKKDEGAFYSFAKLVIRSRILNYIKKESKHKELVSLDHLKEKGLEWVEETKESDQVDGLKEEIKTLKETIEKFGFSFEELVEEAPKHEDTRKRAINLGEKISYEEDLTDFMFKKYRLPLTLIVKRFDVTLKIIKRSKKFIISVVIIFYKKLGEIKLWIRRCD